MQVFLTSSISTQITIQLKLLVIAGEMPINTIIFLTQNDVNCEYYSLANDKEMNIFATVNIQKEEWKKKQKLGRIKAILAEGSYMLAYNRP